MLKGMKKIEANIAFDFFLSEKLTGWITPPESPQRWGFLKLSRHSLAGVKGELIGGIVEAGPVTHRVYPTGLVDPQL